MVEIADSTIISLIPALSFFALNALGLIIISICRLLFFKIMAPGLFASPLYPTNFSSFSSVVWALSEIKYRLFFLNSILFTLLQLKLFKVKCLSKNSFVYFITFSPLSGSYLSLADSSESIISVP